MWVPLKSGNKKKTWRENVFLDQGFLAFLCGLGWVGLAFGYHSGVRRFKKKNQLRKQGFADSSWVELALERDFFFFSLYPPAGGGK